MRCYHYLKPPLIVANGTFLSSKGISQQFLTDYEQSNKLSELGKELLELHLLRHPSLGKNGVGFTESGSDEGLRRFIMMRIASEFGLTKSSISMGFLRGVGISNRGVSGVGEVFEG